MVDPLIRCIVGLLPFLVLFSSHTINGILRLEAPKVCIFAWAHVVLGLEDSRVFDSFQREVGRCHVLAAVLRTPRRAVRGVFVCLTQVNTAAY